MHGKNAIDECDHSNVTWGKISYSFADIMGAGGGASTKRLSRAIVLILTSRNIHRLMQIFQIR